METADKECAGALAKIILNKTGIERNISAIIAALEEQIYGEQIAEDIGDFEETSDYREVTYWGRIFSRISILVNSQPNRNIDARFTEEELTWLVRMSTDGKFEAHTERQNGFEHELHFPLQIPLNPNKSETKDISIYAIAPGVTETTTELHIDIKFANCAEGVLQKALTMYSLV